MQRAATKADMAFAQAVAIHRSGQLDRAISEYKRLLPHVRSAELPHLLAVALQQQERHREALPHLEEATRRNPNHPKILAGLAVTCRKLGRIADAARAFERALSADRACFEALNGLGNLRMDEGLLPDAVDLYRRTLRVQPRAADAARNLALALEGVGRIAEARAALRSAVCSRPGWALAQADLERLGTGLPQDDQAALDALPAVDQLWHEWGVALQKAGKPTDAAKAYEQALRDNEARPETHNNLGVALQHLERFDEATAHFRRAVELDPGYADAHANLGIRLKFAGDFEGSLAAYNRASAICPGHTQMRFSRAIAELALGRFANAWADYRYRDGVDRNLTPQPSVPFPLKMAGTRVRVVRDQGLGDELFFLRFLAALKARGAFVAYEPHPKLSGLLRSAKFIDRLLETDEEMAADHAVSAGDLPFLLEAGSWARLPAPFAIEPPAELVRAWRGRLSSFGPGPYLGVTWRAGSAGPEKLFKAAAPSALGDVLSACHGTVVLLQREPMPDEANAFQQALGRKPLDASAANDDLAEMAALIACLDDYVAVSNTNVHIRAGLGKTCRVLVPHPPEFRWLAEGAESPWFPGFCVYRQALGGSWGDAFDALARDLLHGVKAATPAAVMEGRRA